MTPSENANRQIALRAAIEKCQIKMRICKRRGDMQNYLSYVKQMYALKQQLRTAERQANEDLSSAD